MATELLKKLINTRAGAWDEAKYLLARVERQGRSEFTAEEEQEWDSIQQDIDSLSSRIRELEGDEARGNGFTHPHGRFEHAVYRIGSAEPEAEQASERFVRSWLLGPDPLNDPLGTEAKAPSVWVADMRGVRIVRDPETGAAKVEQRDLSKGVTTAGGFTVPTNFVPRLVEHLIETAAVAGIANQIVTEGGESLQVPKTTSHPTGALVAEAAAIAEADPAFQQVTMNTFKYGVLIDVSTELIQDNSVSLPDYLARSTGVALGNAAGTHFVAGTGTGQPEGVATNVTAGKTGATGQTTTVIADDLFDLYHSIVSGYRRRGSWLMNDGSLAKIRKLKDTTGQFLWQPGLQAGAPDLLLGRPVFSDPNVAVMAANAKSILFGDFNAYYAVRTGGGGIRFERSDDFRFSTDQVAFRALWRVDGRVTDTLAVKSYVNSAT